MEYIKRKKIVKLILKIFLAITIFFCLSSESYAQIRNKAGIHILDHEELDDAISLLKADDEIERSYVTITFPLSDLNRKDDWQKFMKKAKDNKIIPLVRLVTEFDGKYWAIPKKKNIIDQITFLSSLEWPTDEKHIIVFNEPNHITEFGGKVDPADYAKNLKFTADWAHTESKNYKVLPAGLDQAAPNGITTMEAFTFLNYMLRENPDIFEKIDYWNSHSYPNPGFIAPRIVMEKILS